MRFLWNVVVLGCGAAALLGQPARAQDTQAKPAPDQESEVDSYKYTPPGVRKSVDVGNYYLRKGKYPAALSRFQEALQEDSDYAPAYLGLGKAYEKIGLKQKALDAYTKYLDALPSEKDALDAKDVQRAVARLQEEVGTRGAKNRRSSAPAAPPK